MVFGKLMVIEIMQVGRVVASDIEDAGGRARQIVFTRFPPLDGHGMQCQDDAAGQEFILVRAAGVGEEEIDRFHESRAP